MEITGERERCSNSPDTPRYWSFAATVVVLPDVTSIDFDCGGPGVVLPTETAREMLKSLKRQLDMVDTAVND